MRFAELGLNPGLVAALVEQQITEPTPIQVAALPVLLAGRDAYLNSETGTGKTLAYLLPLFGRLDAEQKLPQVVIVAPTHELAIQIQRQCRDLAQNAGLPIRTLLLVGGTSLDRQIESLPSADWSARRPLLELIRMGKLARVRRVAIDEATDCWSASRRHPRDHPGRAAASS
jgi:superfamily II DNA/RNA helicase